MEKMAVVKEQIKEDEKLLLSVREVSNMLGISEKCLRNEYAGANR